MKTSRFGGYTQRLYPSTRFCSPSHSVKLHEMSRALYNKDPTSARLGFSTRFRITLPSGVASPSRYFGYVESRYSLDEVRHIEQDTRPYCCTAYHKKVGSTGLSTPTSTPNSFRTTKHTRAATSIRSPYSDLGGFFSR